ncbi:MAG: hypothetical protein COA43_15655 [Robiginitomaculum sp.]|nr:MAG: hypothetical protein COA43_15655 [Robiginitomaculum sp.]
MPMLAFSPNGQTLLANGWAIKTDCLFSTKQQPCKGIPIWTPNIKNLSFMPKHIAWSQNSRRIVAADNRGYRHPLKPNYQSIITHSEKTYKNRTRHYIIYDGILPKLQEFDAEKFKALLIKNMRGDDAPWLRLSTFYRHYITNGQYIGSLAVDWKTGKVFYFDPFNDVIIDTHSNHYIVKNIKLTTTKLGTTIILLDDVPLPLNISNGMDTWLEALKFTIYPRAIMDSDRHQMIGWVSIEGFKLDTNKLHEKEYQHLNLLLANIYEEKIFNHISIIEYSASIGVLRIDGIDQSRRSIRRIYATSTSEEIDLVESSLIKCHNHKLISENIPNSENTYKSKIYKIGTDKTSIPVLELSSTDHRSQKTLVLYIRGGPRATVVKPKHTDTLLEIFPLDTNDIIMFDYSGAVGASQVSALRLVDGKERALETDVDTIENFIGMIDSAKYEQVVLISSSFSGLMAMQIATDYPTYIDHLILLVPWTHYLPLKEMKKIDPKSFLGAGKRKQIISGYKLFNRNVLGINDKLPTDSFRNWMAEKRKGFEPKMPVLVLEVEWENRIDIEAAEKYFNQYGNVEFRIMPKQYHETILAYPETIDAIKEFLKTK